MSRKRTAQATAAHMRNAALRHEEEAEGEPIKKVTAQEMVAASIYTGTTYTQQRDSLMFFNIKPGSHSSFYRKLKDSEDNIRAATDESTKRARANFSGAAAIDCRWSHRVRATQGTVILADTESPKRSVLARETLVLEGGGRQNPNFAGHSGNMETEGTERMFKKLDDEGFLPQIKSITRDRDNKSGKILDKYGIRDREFHDPGHYKKSFSNIFSSFIKKYRVFECEDESGSVIHISSPFYGLQGPLEHYLANVMKEEDADIREYKWMLAARHFTGDHEMCDHDDSSKVYFWRIGYDNPPVQNVLIKFLEKTAPVIRKLYSKHRSQLVEAINNEIACNAPKDVSWKRIEIRVDAAILKHNEPEDAHRIISECCGVPEPCEEIKNMWEKENSKKIAHREESHQSEALHAKNQWRYAARNKMNDSMKCDYKNIRK